MTNAEININTKIETIEKDIQGYESELRKLSHKIIEVQSYCEHRETKKIENFPEDVTECLICHKQF